MESGDGIFRGRRVKVYIILLEIIFVLVFVAYRFKSSLEYFTEFKEPIVKEKD